MALNSVTLNSECPLPKPMTEKKPDHRVPAPITPRLAHKPPSVSVVIPAYNAREHLPECLESVFRQEVTDGFEVIVVDDGSTDDTRDCMSAFPKVVYLAKTNRGPAAARNTGIKHARGEYIAFLDADDLWPDGKLQTQINLLQQHPDAAMCFGDCRQFASGLAQTTTLFEESGQGVCAWGDAPVLANAYARLLMANFITTGSVIVRREVVDKIGGFNEGLRLVEDLDLWLRIARRYPIIWSPAVCLLRRRHANNLSRDSEAMSLAYLDVLRRQQNDQESGEVAANIDFIGLMAREYGEMAGRALLKHQPEQAMRWAWYGFTMRPSLQGAWRWVQGARHRLKLSKQSGKR